MLKAIFFSGIVIMPLIFAFFVAERGDRFRLAAYLLTAGIFFLIMLYVINSEYPFSGGGDDKNYYEVSKRNLDSFEDWFDFSYVHKRTEQGGYGLLLTWAGQFVGDDLFLRKALNISFYLILSVAWYSIGMKIGGRRLAYVLLPGILLASPLWYYWMFLLKDMTIVLLQSLFLMGAINFFAGADKNRSVIIVVISTLVIIPFRVYLVLVNLGVLIAGLLLTNKGIIKIAFSWRTLIILMASLIVLIIGTNRQMLEKFGVKGKHRSLEVVNIERKMDGYNRAQQYMVKRDRMYFVKYPILIIIGETSGLNPRMWSKIDPGAIRGIAALPWIFLGSPFFLLGMANVFKRGRKDEIQKRGNDDIAEAGQTLGASRKKLLLIIMIFVFAYVAIAWISTDTTRWRMPVMPAMVFIAALGWVNMVPIKRLLFLSALGMPLSLFVLVYYFVLR